MGTKNFYTIDSYDKLFVKCDGTTTSFVDSATAKEITANGNATQLPIKFNKSAGFFNGTTDYVQIADSSDFTFGADNFTVEFFVNFHTAPSGTTLYSLVDHTTGAGQRGWAIRYLHGTGIRFVYTTDGTTLVNTDNAWSPTVGVWYHIAVKRDGNTGTVYVDGSALGTTINFTGVTIFDSTSLLTLGATGAIASYAPIWMKELRISNVARTVSVPTTQYTSDANTVLLMHFDTPATSPLGPAIAFDGTGDYLSLADSADFAHGTGAFTTEIFFRLSATGISQSIVDTRSDNANEDGFVIFLSAPNQLQLNTGSTSRIVGGTALSANRWYHLSIVGNGGADGSRTVKMYLNGVQEGSTYTGNYNFSGQELRFGKLSSTNEYYFNGSMREIRISNVARYTSAFTPSQTGFTVDSNTKLYIKGDENNGVTTFVDSETTPKTVTTAGDTKIKYTEDYRSCIFKDETGKFPYPQGSAKVDFFAIGQGVGYFDGADDCLTIPHSDDFNMGTGDFTIDAYFRTKDNTVAQTIWTHMKVGSPYTGIHWELANTNDVRAYMNSGAGGTSWGTTVINKNQWHHLMLVRASAKLYLFIDGTKQGTEQDSAENIDYTVQALIGAYTDGTSYEMNGRLDNVRVAKGIARYTATFNPPEFTTATNSQIIWVD